MVASGVAVSDAAGSARTVRSSSSCPVSSSPSLGALTADKARLTVELCTPSRRPISTLDRPVLCQATA